MRRRPAFPPPNPSRPRARARERGSSTVEYVGLAALVATIGTGLAGAFGAGAGDRIAATVVRRLLESLAAG